MEKLHYAEGALYVHRNAIREDHYAEGALCIGVLYRKIIMQRVHYA